MLCAIPSWALDVSLCVCAAIAVIVAVSLLGWGRSSKSKDM